MPKPSVYHGITIGTVVDVNDPQQMGRIRVMCPALGDTADTNVTELQWASYASPFGGITTCGTRGPEQATSSGPVAYGMWTIPKVGSHALVMCLDGHLDYRVWIGCLYGQFLPHTLPAGRWLESNTNGPLTSTENPVEPLYSNLRKAFTQGETSPFDSLATTFEGKTRAMENQVAAVDEEVLNQVITTKPDDKNDGSKISGTGTRKGYQQSRQRPNIKFKSTGGNFDSQVYSITTPGMHSFIMDDSLQNGRIRIRSTSGNQIILDDTNERIYINTSDGANWIELDKNGNIDIYSGRRVSIHSDGDINLTAGNTIRMSATDVHIRTSNDIRMDANGCVGIHSTSNLVLESNADSHFTVGNSYHLSAGTDINLTSNTFLNLTSTTQNINLSATQGVNGSIFLEGNHTVGQINMDAKFINVKNGAAIGTMLATSANNIALEGKYAYTSNRVPLHEPWGRVMILKSTTGDEGGGSSASDIGNVLNVTTQSKILQFQYFDGNIGKVDYPEDSEYARNSFWRR